MERIQSISKYRTIDYGDKDVKNFWIRINEKSNYSEKNNNLEQIISELNGVQDSVICIQTEELNHPDIVKAIFNATKKRNRIYILTNEKNESLKELTGACLIRYGINNIGSFILVNPNSTYKKGIIYTAPFIETSLANAENISLKLDNEQVKILFRFFSDNFWNKAEFEIIDDFDNPQQTTEPPLDFMPNINDFCDENFVKNDISKINVNALISVPTIQTNDLINFTSIENTIILTGLKNNNIDLLKETAGKNKIFAYEFNSIRFILSDIDSWLIPKTNIKSDDNLFALKLNKEQKTKLDSLFSKRTENAEYEFNLTKKRQELAGKTILFTDNVKNNIEIKPERTVNAENIELKELLPKEEFVKQEPEFVDDNISVKIRYNWEVIPFFTPNNAKTAKLYDDWKNLQNNYDTFLNNIEKAIIDSKSKNIGDKLKRWFLGKSQTISKFEKQLDELKNKNLSILNKQERKEIIQKINELAKNVSVNLLEIDTEIKKSAIQEEIEQLNKQKEEKKQDLDKFIEEKERKIREIDEKREKRLKEFLEKYKIKKEELPKYRSEWLRKKNKKKEKIKQDQKILNELNEIQGFDFSKKYEDEKQKYEKEIKNIENKIKSKERELEKVGKQQENESSSLNSVFGKDKKNKNTKQNKEFGIPENIEHLPTIGKLFEVGKQKYLEIEYWEDYEIGLGEAKRLKAKLSAKH